jgi:hypothetical protein
MTPSTSAGLALYTASSLSGTFSLNGGKTASHLDIDIGNAHVGQQIRFYNAAGVVIHTENVPANVAGIVHYAFDLPAGLVYSKFDIHSPTGMNGDWLWIDNIQVSGGDFVPHDNGVVTPTAQHAVDATTESLYGGIGDNVFTVADVADFAHVTQIAGNGGMDTLKLTGAGQVLDVTALNSGATDKITGIEVFDIGGTGNNTLRLSLDDVLNLGAKDQFTPDGHYQVMVKGDVGDRVELSGLLGGGAGDWLLSGSVVIDGVTHNVYRNDTTDAEVLVQDGVTVIVGPLAPPGTVFSEDFNGIAPGTYAEIDNGWMKITSAPGTWKLSLRTAGNWSLSNALTRNGSDGAVDVTFALKDGVTADGFTYRLPNYEPRLYGSDIRFEFYKDGVLVHTASAVADASTHLSGLPLFDAVRMMDHNNPDAYALDDISFDIVTLGTPVTALGLPSDVGDSVFTGETFEISAVAELDATDAIVGNDGIDTLKLTGADEVLDLSRLAGKLSSVEVIDITGSGDNTLKLSLGDVLEQGGKDLFVADGKTQMMVKGDAGDTVELSDLLADGSDVGDWAQQSGTVTVEGTQYNVFIHEGLNTELLVQIGVQTNLDNH